jgi:ribosome-associated protein
MRGRNNRSVSEASPNPTSDAPVGDVFDLAPGVRVPASVVTFSYSRSGGPGGQNVNKVSTKAELRVHINDIPISHRARARLTTIAGRRLTDAGELIVVSEAERSQSGNRAECLAKLREMLVQALVEPKVRRKTKPSRGSKERRLKEKKSRGQIKKGRGGGHED